ncbi:MAG: SDR family oxidoreductase [Myxococcales bacterium]|nr:SDR family oxidoreductase [Myxococcales bacterium]HIK84290.1 SDR family oxidoreductase [Myxococcales bacterium]
MTDIFSIHGKVALVTGGGSGIGWMIAEAYVRAGARVYIASRKKEELEARIAELAGEGEGSCSAIVADLSTEAGCNALGDEIESREGSLDILVNNAGANWGAPYEEFPESAWDRVLNVNVKGVFQLTRRLTPLLEKAASDEDPARVINVGSIDGIGAPDLETYSYSASKAAVHHLTAVLAKKLARKKITVNAIAPGPFQSRMMKATLERAGDAINDMVPLSRIGSPEDMAGITIFLASRAGAYLTATVIPIDGGISGTR